MDNAQLKVECKRVAAQKRMMYGLIRCAPFATRLRPQQPEIVLAVTPCQNQKFVENFALVNQCSAAIAQL